MLFPLNKLYSVEWNCKDTVPACFNVQTFVSTVLRNNERFVRIAGLRAENRTRDIPNEGQEGLSTTSVSCERTVIQILDCWRLLK
jgi:hypothetical protein